MPLDQQNDVQDQSDADFPGVLFDYYRGTTDEDPEILAETVCRDLGFPVLAKTEKGANSYEAHIGLWEKARDYEKGKPARITISHGGNSGAAPSLVAPGAYSRLVIPIIRRHYAGRTRVNHLDACLDFDGPDIFDRFLEERDRIHFQSGVWRNDIGTVENGRTLYLGKNTGHSFLRIYEKGKQLAPHMTNPADVEAHQNWVRLEAIYKPKGDAAKRAALGLSPEGVFGGGKTAQHMLRWSSGRMVPVLKREPRMDRTDEEAALYVLRLHARTLSMVSRTTAHKMLDAVLDEHQRNKRGNFKRAG